MEYNEIINRAMDAFYESGRDFPSTMLCPILEHDNEGNVVDRFLMCDVVRNFQNGKIEGIDGPYEIYQQRTDTDTIGEFLKPEQVRSTPKEKAPPLADGVSISEFSALYLQVREFVFKKQITNAQAEALVRLLTIYEELFEAEFQALYQSYGAGFFDWAHSTVRS